jgi:hypothetical protein
VAIKVLRAGVAAVIGAKRSVREIQTIANLQHPRIRAPPDRAMKLPKRDRECIVGRPCNLADPGQRHVSVTLQSSSQTEKQSHGPTSEHNVA